MADAWGGAFGSAWGVSWGSEAAVAAVVTSRGGGYPDGQAPDGRREPDDRKRRRRASEERRYKKLKALDEAVEAAWANLNPEDLIAVEDITVPEVLKPADVRISDLIVRPMIDLDRAALDRELYRQAIGIFEHAIAAYKAQLEDEEDIEILLMAGL